jgi:hypothetical protein
MSLIIPDFQSVPFPAPLWLLKTLLVAGFITHVIPMNVALGGSFWAGISLLRGNGNPTSNHTRMGHDLAMALPFFVSLAITQGIVPLLFLQLIYGPLYYTSSIMMGTPWILLLVILLTAYYALYIYKYKHPQLGKAAGWLLLTVSVLFACVAFLFTNNMTLMLQPETWQQVLPHGTGNFLNWKEPSVLPRYLHFVLSAIAVTGLAVGCFGLAKKSKDEAYANWLIRQGSALFLHTTLVQIGVGSWFLMILPKVVSHAYMGGDMLGSISFIASTLLSLFAMVSTGISWRTGKALPFKVGLVSGIGVVAFMSIMRHVLREMSVQNFFHPEIVPIKTQWDLLIVFIISVVGLIAYLTWLLKTMWSSYQNNSKSLEA